MTLEQGQISRKTSPRNVHSNNGSCHSLSPDRPARATLRGLQERGDTCWVLRSFLKRLMAITSRLTKDIQFSKSVCIFRLNTDVLFLHRKLCRLFPHMTLEQGQIWKTSPNVHSNNGKSLYLRIVHLWTTRRTGNLFEEAILPYGSFLAAFFSHLTFLQTAFFAS